jgi:2-polyprenyl-3-methyl-5-hydroxy-6-metoxy-1,4-benzoquinol methylase
MVESNSYNSKGHFKQWLIRLHYRYSQNFRSEILANKIAEIINSKFDASRSIRILDFGCGDMKVAKCVREIIPSTNWTGTDVRENWENEELGFPYAKFERNILPFESKSFDVVLMNDVLHHVNEKEQAKVMSECLRVGDMILIKDVFEKGYFSRFILIMMDIAGNWAYGVKTPTRYFTKKRFSQFCNENSVNCEIITSEIALYDHLPFFVRLLSPPNLHFIAILRNINK